MTVFAVREEQAYVGSNDERGEIVLGEDEFVLDAEYRGANRVVVAVASPVKEAPDIFQCDECDKVFETEHGLKVHEGSQH